MKSQTKDTRGKPHWVQCGLCKALIVTCGKCFDHPGSKHNDGSGVCEACGGSGWKVLAKNVSADNGG